MTDFLPNEAFGVVVIGGYTPPKEIDTLVQAFSDFYHDVTSKHQKKIKLWIAETKDQHNRLHQVANMFELPTEAYQLIDLKAAEVSDLLKQSALLLLPATEKVVELILMSLKVGTPVIGYETLETQDLIDTTCGMLLKPKTKEANVRAFTELIDMLYFDPEVLKILKKGAKERYTQYRTGSIPSSI